MWGHSYDTIHCVFNKYITFYHEFQDHGIVYYGALHDEWRHAYESLNTNNAQIDSYILGDTPIYCKLRFNDVFKSGTRDDVVRLIEDAVESPFIKTIIYNSNEGETYRSGNRAVFRRLHYKDLIAWGKDGIIFSIDYDDEDPNISFAKAHIVVVIPYAKLKPFLKYPFKNLAK